MEAKFFKEIEKQMDVKTLKDFEKELRTKISHELEVERKTNPDLARILLSAESILYDRIVSGGYNWLKITDDRKARLFKLIALYTSFNSLVEDVARLNAKVDAIKKMKEGDDE